MSEKAAEAKHRKSRQYIVPGSIVFLVGLLLTVVWVLSIAGYLPPMDAEEYRGAYYVPPLLFGIISIYVVVLGLCMMAYGYILRKRVRK